MIFNLDKVENAKRHSALKITHTHARENACMCMYIVCMCNASIPKGLAMRE